MKVNIPKSNQDPFFRYKRDEIEIRIINTNGGNTELINIKNISSQLNENIELIIKFIKKKINTNIIKKDEKYICNNIISKENIETYIEEYIKKFILCAICANPEFTKQEEKNKEIRICKACGAKR
jgi:translation initiation factor 2 beta subunit (eIF-2beta)/eIF-5